MLEQLPSTALLTWLLYLTVAIALTILVEGMLGETLPQWGFSTGLRIWVYIIQFAFLSSLATAPLLDNASRRTAILFHTVPIVVILIYFVPTAIAVQRSSQRVQQLFFINLFTGWTVVGWLWTLVAAFRT